MKKISKLFLLLLMLFSFTALSACNKEKEYTFNIKNTEIDMLVGDEVTVEYETNYKGELLWESYNTDIATVDENGKITAVSRGLVLITVSYEDVILEINVSIKDRPYELIKHIVNIDGEEVSVVEGTLLRYVLLEKYEDRLFPNKDGKVFIGWFYDHECKDPVDYDLRIMNDVNLYSKYEDEITNCTTLTVDYTVGYNGKYHPNGQVQVFSPSYAGTVKFENFTYEDQVFIVANYDIKTNSYYVTSILENGAKNDTKIPFDGFIVSIAKNNPKYQTYMNEIKVGTKINLDHYSINKANKIYIDKPVEAFTNNFKFVGNIGCDYASSYDVTNSVQLYDKSGDSKAYPASTTKVITGLTALQFASLDDTYTIEKEIIDLTYEGSSPSTAGLKAGQVWTMRQLLYAMLLPSGNDAAYGVAACAMQKFPEYANKTARERIDKFAEMMTEFTTKIGATNCHFMTPDGNSYYTASNEYEERALNHYVTANDMVKVANYAFACGALAEVMGTASISYQIESGENIVLSNTNSFIKSSSSYYNPYVIGGKTGTTNAAGGCLISGAEKDGRFIIVVVLKASDRYASSRLLYNQILGI